MCFSNGERPEKEVKLDQRRNFQFSSPGAWNNNVQVTPFYFCQNPRFLSNLAWTITQSSSVGYIVKHYHNLRTRFPQPH